MRSPLAMEKTSPLTELTVTPAGSVGGLKADTATTQKRGQIFATTVQRRFEPLPLSLEARITVRPSNPQGFAMKVMSGKGSSFFAKGV